MSEVHRDKRIMVGLKREDNLGLIVLVGLFIKSFAFIPCITNAKIKRVYASDISSLEVKPVVKEGFSGTSFLELRYGKFYFIKV